MASAGDVRRANVGQLLTQVVTELREQAGTTNRLYEIVLMPSPATGADVAGVQAGRGSRTTGGIRRDSVPAALADTVARDAWDAGQQLRRALLRPQRAAVRATRRATPFPDSRSAPSSGSGQGGSYQLYFLFPLTEEQKTLGLVRGRLAAMGVLLALLLCAIAFLVTRSVVQPVRQAARVAERIAAGRLAERMIERGEDDLARLASSFNGMASTLQRQIGQLEDLSRLQRRFVSDVSHELRTPLTTIRMAAEMIYEKRDSFDPHVARSAELMYDQVDRFEALLTELLEISRYDAGAAVLEAEPIDLRDVCRRVVDSVEPVARQYRSAIEARPAGRVVRGGDGPPAGSSGSCATCCSTPSSTGRAATSRSASPRTPTPSPSRSGITASDCGRGSPRSAFNRFWRADPARARRSGGTGLGAVDRARGRAPARRLAAGLGRTAGWCAVPAHPAARDRRRAEGLTDPAAAGRPVRRAPPGPAASAAAGPGGPVDGPDPEELRCVAGRRGALRAGPGRGPADGLCGHPVVRRARRSGTSPPR